MCTNLWYLILVGTVPKSLLEENLFALVLRLGCLCGSDGFPYNIKIYQGKEKKLLTREVTLCLLKVQQHRELESSAAAELPLDVQFDGVNHLDLQQRKVDVKCAKKYKKYVHKMQHSSPLGAWQN